MRSHFEAQGRRATNLVQTNAERLRTKPKGRVCAHPDCETRLSIYNSKDECSVHEDYERVHPNTWLRGT